MQPHLFTINTNVQLSVAKSITETHSVFNEHSKCNRFTTFTLAWLVRFSPGGRPGVFLEVYGCVLFEEDVNVAVEAGAFGGEGGEVVTQDLS